MDVTAKIARFVADTKYRDDPVKSHRDGEDRGAGLPWSRAGRQ